MSDPEPKPRYIVSVDDSEPTPEPAPEVEAKQTPEEDEEERKSRFPDWADVPKWGKNQGFPAGVEIIFMPFEVSKMRRKMGGKPIKMRDGSVRICRQAILWELSLSDRIAAFSRSMGDANRAADELAMQMIRAIDGEPVSWASEASPTWPRRFFADLGSKYQSLVHSIYTRLHVLSDKEYLDFFASCVESRVAPS